MKAVIVPVTFCFISCTNSSGVALYIIFLFLFLFLLFLMCVFACICLFIIMGHIERLISHFKVDHVH